MDTSSDSKKGTPQDSTGYFSIFDQSQDRIWVIDEKFCLVYGNILFQQHAHALTGKIIEKGGYVFDEKVPDHFKAEWIGYFKRAFAGETFHIELATKLTPKSEVIDYLFNPVKDDTGKITRLIISGRTITRQRQLEEQLKKNESLLNRAECIAGFGNWEFDLKNYFVRASDGAKKIYGLMDDSWSIQKIQNIPLKEYRDILDHALKELIEDGKPYDVEFKIRRPNDNQIRDIHSIANYDSEKRTVFGVIHDITEQKKSESDIIRAGTLFKKVWDFSNDGMRLTDEKGITIRVNQAFCIMVDKKREELEGLPLAEIYEPGSGAVILSHYLKKIQQGNIAANLEKEFILWNGKKVWFSVTISPLEGDSSGKIILSAFRDNTEKKLSEIALRKSEERYQNLVRTSIDGFLTIDVNGKILESNEAYQIMSGYSSTELLQMRLPDIEALEDLEDTRRHMSELLTKKWDKFETKHRKKNGEIIDLEVNTIFLDTQNIFLAFFSNITDRKNSEKELIENREELKSYFDFAPYGIFIADSRGKYLVVNEAAYRMYGYTRDEFLSLSITDVLPEGSVAAGIEHFSKLKSEGFAEGEILMKRKDGSTFTGAITAVPLSKDKFMAFCIDISKRKAMQEQLNSTEERLRLALEAANDGLWDWNMKSGKLYWSPRNYTMLGYEPDEFTASLEKWKELLHPEDRDKAWAIVQQSTATGDRSFRIEFRFKTKYGKYIWILGRGKAVEFDLDGSIKRMLGTHTDISDLKHAEEALKESEERYRKITGIAPFGIFLVRDGKYIYCNAKGASMLGYNSSEEIIGLSVEETIDSGDLSKIIERITKCSAGESNPPTEMKIIRRDGSIIVSESTSVPILLSDGPAIMVMGADQTERKKTEEALKNREAKISSLFRAAPVGIGMVVDRIIVETNLTLLQMTGYSYEDLIGRSSRILYLSDEDYTHVGKEKYRQIAEKGTGDVETRWIKKDGSIINIILSSTPLDASDLMKGVTFTALDITERKNAELSLIFEEKMLSAIAKATKELLTNRDTDSAIIKSLSLLGEATEIDRAYFFENDFVDNKAANTFSHKFEWVSSSAYPQINNPRLQNVPFKGNEEFITPLSQGLAFKYLVKDIPECATKKMLSSQNILSILVLPVFVKNIFFGFVGFDDCRKERIWKESEYSLLAAFCDSVAKAIERRMIEEELKYALRELKETQKQVLLQERLRSLGQMTSGICHDINNSLTPIMGYVDILRDDEDLMQRYGKAFNMIIKSSNDIANTIGRLKEFYKLRLSPDELKQTDLNQLIHDTIELTRHRWKNIPESTGARIEIIEDLDPDIPFVKTDESELREAVMNVILNACDAMPKGGKLSFKTTAVNDHVHILIKDSGIGMDEETLFRCIDPFFSTKGEKGTGLGLSMVFGIMERHRGEVMIDSKPGEGTTVTLILPFDRDIKEDLFIDSIAGSTPALRILYIEDDEAISDMIKQMLEKRRHTVVLSSNGKEGLKIYQNSVDSNEPFDLVITDLGMAEMDGLSLSKLIKDISPDIPLILFTGWGALVNKDDLTTVDCLLKKPILKEDLFKAISSLFK